MATKSIRSGPPLNQQAIIALAVACVFLAANVVQAGKVFDLYHPDANRIAYAVQAVIAVAYALLALRRGDLLLVVLSVVVAGGIFSAHIAFVELTKTPPNFNTVFTFVPLLSIIPFCGLMCPMRLLLRAVFGVSLLYVITYLITNAIILADPGQYREFILEGHDPNSDGRVYLAGAYTAYVAMFALTSQTMKLYQRLGTIALAALALWQSDTRVYMGVVVIVFGIAAAGYMTPLVRGAMLAVVLTGMATLLAGLAVTGWNPFDLMASNDRSFIYRSLEYDRIIPALKAHWLTGVGIPSHMADLQNYLHAPPSQPIYASDLGVIGMFFQFGIAGLLFFIAAVAFVLYPRTLPSNPEHRALELTCIVGAVYGITSPMLVLEPSVIFLMLLIAQEIRRRRQNGLATARAGKARQQFATMMEKTRR